MSSLAVRAILVALLLAGCAPMVPAQPLFTDALPAEEFADRRARVMEHIGDGVAIVSGATEYPAYVPFRQNNQFFYLSGVEVPRALLLIDGRAKRTTLFLPRRNERAEASEGPVLVPGSDAARLTGIESVVDRDEFGGRLARLGQEGRTLFLPFRPESLGAATPQQALSHVTASASDPWDGRVSKEAAFIERIRAQVPQLVIRNLDEILDTMRQVKSAREIALIREATRIAGLGLMEGMRSARPGLFEYEVAALADYEFRRHNALGPAYFALVATGTNAHYPHYHALQGRLEDGHLVLFDYAPDYKYYASDVTRMFPASGRFSAAQRELYTVYLRLYQALMTSIRPGATPEEITEAAVRKMDAFVASHTFSDAKLKDATTRFVDGYRNRSARNLGHGVGMEVHDVTAPFETLKPGMVFTIEPALTIPEDRVYVRLEDVILITDTGYENLSAAVPVEIEDIERLMAEDGIADRAPRRAVPESPAARRER